MTLNRWCSSCYFFPLIRGLECQQSMLFQRKWWEIASEVSTVDLSWQERTKQLTNTSWTMEKIQRRIWTGPEKDIQPQDETAIPFWWVFLKTPEWDPHSPAICSRAELSFVVQNILPKCKTNLLLLPITVSASCSGQQGLKPPSQGAFTLSSSHQITHKGARSFTTDLQVFLGPLRSFLSCWSADFWTGHL